MSTNINWTDVLSSPGAAITYGVVSSLVWFLAVVAAAGLRRGLDHRWHRKLLGNDKAHGILTPWYQDSDRLLTTDNAYAIADVIQLCRTVNSSVHLEPARKREDDLPTVFPSSRILVGGQRANPQAHHYMAEFCPGLVYPDPNVNVDDQDIFYTWSGEEHRDSDEYAWSFIIKLVVADKSPILLMFGPSSFGTAQAVRLVCANPRKFARLARVNLDGPFAVAFRSRRGLGPHTPEARDVLNVTAAFISSAVVERAG